MKRLERITESLEISPGLEIVGSSLWIKPARALVINDLHLGYEEALHRKGILVPKYQLETVLMQLVYIISIVNPQKIIINGYLKHESGTILGQEWREVLELLDFLLQKVNEVIIIQGNHDTIIKPIAEKRGITVVKEWAFQQILVVHGDKIVKTKAKQIIIGHEHPAITIREGGKREKYKCFLKGKWKDKEIIAVPSFNPLLEGTDILQEQVLSPFLKSIKNFKVYIIHQGEVFEFGKVKNLISDT